MTLTQRTDHVDQGLSLLASQYKSKPSLEAYLSSFLDQIQILEDVFFDILAIVLSTSTQEGEQLDLIGRIVGQPREGRSDEDYLPWIQARIIVNRSSGLPDEYLQIADLLSPDSARTYTEIYPAALILELIPMTNPSGVAGILRCIHAAGVNAQMEYALSEADECFTFASGDSEEASTTMGFASGDTGEDPETGGVFADVEQI